MVYKVIGLMSGSSLDGLDIAFVHLQEKASTAKNALKKWEYSFVHTATYPYSEEWRQRLAKATELSALDYQLLHTEYGHYLGEQVLRFIEANGLHYQVQLIASHGHTTFHVPAQKMTAQLGDGAAIAAAARINVVSDLRAMDLALGGQGAPIVPIGERLLLGDYDFFLNLGGIANVSRNSDPYVAFDICPANRVLNELAALEGQAYDEGGALAASGRVNEDLLSQLDALPYYAAAYPKSLANSFGTDTVLPVIKTAMADSGGRLLAADALATYVEHIAGQVERAVKALSADTAGGETAGADTAAGAATGSAQAVGLTADGAQAAGSAQADSGTQRRLLATGGGAHNKFLIQRLQARLGTVGIAVEIPDATLADHKEALIMALIGVLRWREETNVLSSVTGASRDSIGGAMWIGQDA